jgi:hypothetical protein
LDTSYLSLISESKQVFASEGREDRYHRAYLESLSTKESSEPAPVKEKPASTTNTGTQSESLCDRAQILVAVVIRRIICRVNVLFTTLTFSIHIKPTANKANSAGMKKQAVLMNDIN